MHYSGPDVLMKTGPALCSNRVLAFLFDLGWQGGLYHMEKVLSISEIHNKINIQLPNIYNKEKIIVASCNMTYIYYIGHALMLEIKMILKLKLNVDPDMVELSRSTCWFLLYVYFYWFEVRMNYIYRRVIEFFNDERFNEA